MANSWGLFEIGHYLTCCLVFAISVSTIGNFQLFVSNQSLKYWDEDATVIGCFLWDLALICLFIGQHSVMATPWLKRNLHSWLRVSVSERLFYLCATCITIMVMIIYWYSIPDVYLWYIDTYDNRPFLWTFFILCHFAGWLIICLEVMMMDPGELFGFTQVYNYHNNLLQPLMGKKATQLKELYMRMRHPGAVVLTVLLWCHPLMTLDRLLLASVFTSYLIWRHEFEDVHCAYAEKHFYTEITQRKSSKSVTYEYYAQE